MRDRNRAHASCATSQQWPTTSRRGRSRLIIRRQMSWWRSIITTPNPERLPTNRLRFCSALRQSIKCFAGWLRPPRCTRSTPYETLQGGLCGLTRGPASGRLRELRRSYPGSGAPSLEHCRGRFWSKVLGRFSDFLECASLDLPDAFTRHPELCRQVFQRQRLVDQMSCFEDTTFAVVQYVNRRDQCLMLVLLFVLFDDDCFGRRRLIDEMVLPFPDFTVLVKRRVNRFIAAEPSVHVDDILVGDVKVLCDQSNLIGT